jgi:DNA repair exonuclease SbcCD ATPase subunit
MTRIVELRAENFKRIKALTVTPDRNVVILNGPNGAGKSSAIDAIWAVLGGKSASPAEPIRRGSDAARAVVTLDSGLTVERTWTESGTRLVVRDASGAKYSSPQAILDKLTETLAFDPLRFASMRPDEQTKLLRQLTGCDTTTLDAQRQATYEARTAKNRVVRELDVELGGLLEHPDAPSEEVSVAALSGQLRDAQKAASARDKLQSEADRCRAESARLFEQALQAKAQAEAMADKASELTISALDIDVPDSAALLTQLEQAEQVNKAVRENARRAVVELRAEEAREQSQELTRQLEQLDEEKRRLLAEASFPIEGLGFGDGGVTYQGLPLAQASHAERVRISTAIGIALHPELRVLLIRDAEKLDSEGMRLIAELAAQHDAQLWLERAGHSDAGALVIEDGELRQ